MVRFTHIALQVRDIERSIDFYARYCKMKIVHERTDETHVVWMGWGEDPPQFVIVLLEEDYVMNTQPPTQHVGLAVDSREEVDSIFARALKDGVRCPWKPRDAGPVVGYYCGIADPDGNLVEFSYGQRIGAGGAGEGI